MVFFLNNVGKTCSYIDIWERRASVLFDVILLILGSILEPEGSIFGPNRALGAPWGLPGRPRGPKGAPGGQYLEKVSYFPPFAAPSGDICSNLLRLFGVCWGIFR